MERRSETDLLLLALALILADSDEDRLRHVLRRLIEDLGPNIDTELRFVLADALRSGSPSSRSQRLNRLEGTLLGLTQRVNFLSERESSLSRQVPAGIASAALNTLAEELRQTRADFQELSWLLSTKADFDRASV